MVGGTSSMRQKGRNRPQLYFVDFSLFGALHWLAQIIMVVLSCSPCHSSIRRMVKLHLLPSHAQHQDTSDATTSSHFGHANEVQTVAYHQDPTLTQSGLRLKIRSPLLPAERFKAKQEGRPHLIVRPSRPGGLAAKRT
jgi:hypothetical protein